MDTLVTRYGKQVVGTLSCFDRVIIRGTLPGVCYAEGMEAYLRARNVRLYDYPRFAAPYNRMNRDAAHQLAKDAGCEIEVLRGHSISKEERIREVLKARGNAPGLIHVFASMELCATYRARYHNERGTASLRPDGGKCTHYYFYFMDRDLGVCYIRVPTWCPFQIQFYFNGHAELAAKLRRAGVDFQMADNAFVQVSDFATAQRLANKTDAVELHKKLDHYAALCCPAAAALEIEYHWSFAQVEYSTDIIFRRQSDLRPIYETVTRAAIHAAKADDVATFLGRKLHGNYRNELGNNFKTRIEGTRIKHHMGPVSIKMYDKAGLVLRIETTTNDVTFFQHHRFVEQRDGKRVFKLAPLRKTIHNIRDLQDLMAAANRRYLAFISELERPSAGLRALQKVTAPVTDNGRRYRGLNFFAPEDDAVLKALARGENTIKGFRNRDIRRFLTDKSPSWISRYIKRLRLHGLIKSVGRTYKYYLTEFGRRVVLTGTVLRETLVVSTLARDAQA